MSPGDLKPVRRQSEVFLQKRLSDGLFIADIFALIDAMPMRQDEMRKKKRLREFDPAAPNKSGDLE